jgi:phosphatidylinositol glycan anchor class Y biosynthesis protein
MSSKSVKSFDTNVVYGTLIVIASFLFFVTFAYAIVLSKLLPKMGVGILDAIQDDTLYCLLIPMTIISFVFFVFINWLSFKFFRHN